MNEVELLKSLAARANAAPAAPLDVSRRVVGRLREGRPRRAELPWAFAATAACCVSAAAVAALLLWNPPGDGVAALGEAAVQGTDLESVMQVLAP
jgi:hypothetical protein